MHRNPIQNNGKYKYIASCVLLFLFSAIACEAGNKDINNVDRLFKEKTEIWSDIGHGVLSSITKHLEII